MTDKHSTQYRVPDAPEAPLHEDLPAPEDVEAAADRLRAHLPPTPAHRYPLADRALGRAVFIKHENHHEVGAFKVRGALNHLIRLKARGIESVITASTGNHGLGVAEAARRLRMTATIVAPLNPNPSKVERIRALGAEVLERGDGFEAARRWAEQNAELLGASFVNTTDPDIIAGAATYALELYEAYSVLDAVIVPIGGGSGACGCLLAAACRGVETKVIGVQSAQAPAMFNAWRTGECHHMPSTTFAEGIAVEGPFANTVSLLRRSLSDFVLVEDTEIRDAQRAFFRWTGELIEGAAAASIAALMHNRISPDHKRVGVIVTGRNLGEKEALLALESSRSHPRSQHA